MCYTFNLKLFTTVSGTEPVRFKNNGYESNNFIEFLKNT